MMMDYEWGNPADAAAAMLLFGEDVGHVDPGQDQQQQQPLPPPPQQHLFDHYGAHVGFGMDYFHQPQPISAATLFSTSAATSAATCHQGYGLMLPHASPARIGLNLGVRTYFSSGSPEEGMMVARVCRRRTRTARCQAEGCGADLTHAKHYHRRHKVCEFHSKASIVIAAGLSQRFCQQCSRFHVLSEFDQGKRSCRKRLADHNRRRRKSQDLSTPSTVVSSQNTNNKNEPLTTGNNNVKDYKLTNPEKSLIAGMTKSETCSLVSHPLAEPQHLACVSAPQMALGLGCGAIPAPTSLSASSSTGTSPPQCLSFLSQLGEFQGTEHRFPSWDEAEDESSIRELFQNK